LGVTGIVFGPTDNLTEFKNQPTLTGGIPSGQFHAAGHVGRFVVLLEPIAAGKIGRGVASAFTVCRVNVLF